MENQTSKPKFLRKIKPPNLTSTQQFGFTWKWLYTTQPLTQTQCQPYLNSYWPNFDQTLEVGSWKNKNRFQPSLWHLSRQHMSWRHLSTLAISQLLLTWFGWNFKSISSNICPSDICPYQQYIISSYWPDFDKLFGPKFLGSLIFFWPIIFWETKVPKGPVQT